jgi:hypothetical protein
MKPSEVLFPSTRGEFGIFDSIEIICASESHTHDWRGIDTGRMCATCGMVEQQGPTYSGTMVRDLYARVDNVLALSRSRSSSVDDGEPWAILANARGHVADAMCADGADIPALIGAYFDMGKLQDCLILEKTAVCRNCREMEGLHRAYGYCRKQSMNGDPRLSQRFEAE